MSIYQNHYFDIFKKLAYNAFFIDGYWTSSTWKQIELFWTCGLSPESHFILKKIKSEESIMAAKFTVYKDKAEQFRFNLKAANGEIIAVAGESYPDKKPALKGIASIITVVFIINVPYNSCKGGQYYFCRIYYMAVKSWIQSKLSLKTKRLLESNWVLPESRLC